jgi:hypothetical protein
MIQQAEDFRRISIVRNFFLSRCYTDSSQGSRRDVANRQEVYQISAYRMSPKLRNAADKHRCMSHMLFNPSLVLHRQDSVFPREKSAPSLTPTFGLWWLRCTMIVTIDPDTVTFGDLGDSSCFCHHTCCGGRGSGCGCRHRVGVAVRTRLSMHDLTRDQHAANTRRGLLPQDERFETTFQRDCLSGRAVSGDAGVVRAVPDISANSLRQAQTLERGRRAAADVISV